MQAQPDGKRSLSGTISAYGAIGSAADSYSEGWGFKSPYADSSSYSRCKIPVGTIKIGTGAQILRTGAKKIDGSA